MTVGELKKILEGVNEDMQVLVPFTTIFDGRFYSPCSIESGVAGLGTDMYINEEDIKEMELLNKPIPQEDSFLIVPCGFTEEKDHSHELN